MGSKPDGDITLVKIGGSSITDKGNLETVNIDALNWLVQTIKRAIQQHKETTCKRFIIVHGAGSFGHHTAKEYGLKGITTFPPVATTRQHNEDIEKSQESSTPSRNRNIDQHQLLGLGRTRISVQKLNQIIVKEFLDRDLPAVGISPCFGILQETPVGLDDNGSCASPEMQQDLIRSVVKSAIDAGLIPVLHGDAE